MRRSTACPVCCSRHWGGSIKWSISKMGRLRPRRAKVTHTSIQSFASRELSGDALLLSPEILSFINKYLLSAYCASGTMLGAGDIAVTKGSETKRPNPPDTKRLQ